MKSDTRQFQVGCELSYQVNGPSAFIMNVSAVTTETQRVLEESITVEPTTDLRECDNSGEDKRLHRFSAEAGPLVLRYSALVETHPHLEAGQDLTENLAGDLPTDVVQYLYPSRYCESDKLTKFATDEFGNLPSGYARVTGVCNWIHEHVEYLRGTTSPSTSAYDTVTQRAGVCRDFAHLAIALCRALGIPARFCAGYAIQLDPPDFHACFEAYLGQRWYFFDATRLTPQTGFVRIGTGRDAADTSFATLFGPVAFQEMTISMEHKSGPKPEFTTEAVSL